MNNFDEAVSGEVVTKVVSTDVVEFKEETILQAISEGGELDFLTEKLREKVMTFEHDLTTGVGRKRSASFAYNISQAKTRVIKFAKSTIAKDEAKIKKVKSSLKNVSADFDDLRDKARLPLTEWEAEDARKKAEFAAQLEAAKRQAEQAKRDKIAAEERAKVQAEEAEKRRIEAEATAKRNAEQAAENARLAEVKRQESIAAKEKADQALRDANTRNVGLKRKQAKESLVAHTGIDEATARKIVLAINAGKIDNVTIKY